MANMFVYFGDIARATECLADFEKQAVLPSDVAGGGLEGKGRWQRRDKK